MWLAGCDPVVASMDSAVLPPISAYNASLTLERLSPMSGRVARGQAGNEADIVHGAFWRRGEAVSATHPSEDPRFVDTKTVARRGSFHPDYLRKLRRTGCGPPYLRIGRTIRYCIRSFDKWMRSSEFQSQADELARGQEEGVE